MTTAHDRLAGIAAEGARHFSGTRLATSHDHVTRRVRRDRAVHTGVTAVAGVGVIGAGAFGLMNLGTGSEYAPAGPAATPSGSASTAPTPEAAASTPAPSPASSYLPVDDTEYLAVSPEDHADDVAASVATRFGITQEEATAALAAALPPEAQGSIEGWVADGQYAVTDSDTLEDVAINLTSSISGWLEATGVPRDQWHATVIAASIVDAEVPLDAPEEDYQVVADVIANRLAADIMLQVDSPLAYALDAENTTISDDGWAVDSPFNTYKYEGLPPTAIGVVQAWALRAVVDAPTSDVEFFVLNPDTQGLSGATTFEEFQQLLFEAGLLEREDLEG
ncbi:endolytic transglycosylase MltG [Demequina globuliformis]|uniref:endolytic transglycosylase MltG n=1 Tax=Demequina globuliformis TaxID=676202 RepID=UPI000785F180|nr:endolytic transglycosylase MltG [Demequina globuliformis]